MRRSRPKHRGEIANYAQPGGLELVAIYWEGLSAEGSGQLKLPEALKTDFNSGAHPPMKIPR